MEQQKPQFRYYYGDESEQFSFFKIPKLLITHEFFRGLSNDAKILYGLLLDRMSLSQKNKWYDEENRAYIVCSIEEITELLNCSRNKAIKSLQELDTDKGIGLIEKRRLGQGNNTIMYVKNFLIPQEMISQQSNADAISKVQNLNFKKSKIWTIIILIIIKPIIIRLMILIESYMVMIIDLISDMMRNQSLRHINL